MIAESARGDMYLAPILYLATVGYPSAEISTISDLAAKTARGRDEPVVAAALVRGVCGVNVVLGERSCWAV